MPYGPSTGGAPVVCPTASPEDVLLCTASITWVTPWPSFGFMANPECALAAPAGPLSLLGLRDKGEATEEQQGSRDVQAMFHDPVLTVLAT